MNTTITGKAVGSDGIEINHRVRRIWVLLSAALVPITVSIFLTGAFYLFGDYRVIERVPAKTSFASINFPQKNKPVGSVFTAKGSVSGLPDNTSLAYLMVKRDEHYWPKQHLGSQPGDWSKEIREAKRGNSRLSVVVLAMGAEGKAQIDQWYATSKKTGKYPGIAEIATAQEIAQIEVKQ